MFSNYKNNCCHYKSLLHAKPSASVNTVVHVGGVYATDKLRRVELYREEVSNKQLYNCIIRDVSCSALLFIEWVWNISSSFESIRLSLLLVGSASTLFCLPSFETRWRPHKKITNWSWHSASILTKTIFSNIPVCSSRKLVEKKKKRQNLTTFF